MSGWSGHLGEAIGAAQAGDQRAFDVIYDRFADALFRYLAARTGEPGLAEELLGELWVRVVERLPAFRIPDDPEHAERAFAAWLYRIARNLSIDHARRSARHSLPLDEELSGDDDEPDAQLIADEEHAALHEAMGRLTADQREVVLLRFFEQRSHADVAAITGRSEGAVKVMQHRAIGALARILGIDRRRSGDSEL